MVRNTGTRTTPSNCSTSKHLLKRSPRNPHSINPKPPNTTPPNPSLLICRKLSMLLQRRLLCTQVPERSIHPTHHQNSNLNNKKWAIKQVTKSNFAETLEEIKTHIFNSDFIAVSLQKTGAFSSPWQKVLPFDTAEVAYLKAKYAAERFQVLQFAVCPLSVKSSKIIAHP